MPALLEKRWQEDPSATFQDRIEVSLLTEPQVLTLRVTFEQDAMTAGLTLLESTVELLGVLLEDIE
ncbi:MAG TPA: hypothetical protein EYG03_22590 [Planctomycetes bacterium]|nr:hypothetical protein [Fuerstiella sp.]HIK94743.1 hypothetical protein [Planctomycetota bacterium]